MQSIETPQDFITSRVRSEVVERTLIAAQQYLQTGEDTGFKVLLDSLSDQDPKQSAQTFLLRAGVKTARDFVAAELGLRNKQVVMLNQKPVVILKADTHYIKACDLPILYDGWSDEARTTLNYLDMQPFVSQQLPVGGSECK